MTPTRICPWIVPLIAFLLTAGCGPTIVYVPLDDAFYQKNLTRNYNHSRDQCFQATRNALLEQEFELKYESDEKGELVTKRKSYTTNASVTRPVTSTGRTSSGETVTMSRTEVDHFTVQQSHQYYLRISGDAKECEIAAFRWRAWNGEEEMDKLQPPGVDWAKQHLFEPFFAEVERILEGKPY